MVGCTEYLTMQVGSMPCKVHAHVVENAPFKLLLGQPFGHAVSSVIEDLPNRDVEVSVWDPTNPACRVYIPTRPCKGHITSIKILSIISDADSSINCLFPSDVPRSPIDTEQRTCDPPSAPRPFPPLPPSDATALTLTYKKVANK